MSVRQALGEHGFRYAVLGVAMYAAVCIIVMSVLSFNLIAYPREVQLHAAKTTVALLALVPPPILYFFVRQLVRNQDLVAELRKLAQTDPVTGLKNRFGFDADLAAALETVDTQNCSLALILFDLDHFKGINDRFGHDAGDAVLKVVGKRLSHLPAILSIARIGGDEFAVVVDANYWPDFDDLEAVSRDVEHAMGYVYRPVNHMGRDLHIGGSAGMSRYPFDATTKTEMIHHADAALLDAKRNGRGRLVIYNSRLDEKMRRNRQLEKALPVFERSGELEVVFQPIVAMKTGQMAGAEVLARWKHDSLGPISPVEFLSIARESGFGAAIEEEIRATAFQQAAALLNSGRLSSLSLNTSPLDVSTRGFSERWLQQLETHRIDPRQIWLEVTESDRVEDIGLARKNLDELHAHGVRVALDDYGAGYSNIRTLLDLPIDRLKVDRSIVKDLCEEARLQSVLVSIVHLARAIGAEVVAEGVETEGQLALVRAAGCGFVQGHYFARALSKQDLLMQLQRNAASAA